MPANRPLRRSVLIPNQHTLAQQLPLLLLCFSLGCFLTLTLPRLTHAQPAHLNTGDRPVTDRSVAPLPQADRAVSDRPDPDRSGSPASVATSLNDSALLDRLPPPQAHPLPPSLQPASVFPGTGLLSALPPAGDAPTASPDRSARTAGPSTDFGPSTDYFDQIRPTPLGYLVWSQFPVWVYREAVTARAGSGEALRQEQWRSAVEQAVGAWQSYVPLAWTDDREAADIQILRSRPPLRYQDDGSIARARTAETRYQLRLVPTAIAPTPGDALLLQPQFTLYLGPGQAPAQLATTARHELGHALGLWGHSLDPQDVMYGEQTAQPQAVSQRDVNTLRRVYQQPTRMGWPLKLD